MEDLLNKVHCSDAIELLAQIPDNSIDMVLTSPPYDNLREYKGYVFPFEDIAQETFRVLKDGGVLVWVVGDATVNGCETGTSFKQALYFMECGFKLHDTMIWNKGARYPDLKRYYQSFEYMFVLLKGQQTSVFNPITKRNKKNGVRIIGSERETNGKLTKMSGQKENRRVKAYGVLQNVWYIPAGFNLTTKDKDAYQHPAMFPEELARRHIYTWSSEGDIVLDYFMGSGTTAKIARNMNRQFIGGDVAQEYVDIARMRLQNSNPYVHSIKADGSKQLSLFEKLDKTD